MAETNKYLTRLTTLRKLKDAKDKKNEELKAINAEIEVLERELVSEMEIDGLDKISIAGLGTASLSVKSMPTVSDMEAFVAWCYENNKVDLIQKRVSSKACNDYIEETNEMPDGINIYEETKIGFRRN